MFFILRNQTLCVKLFEKYGFAMSARDKYSAIFEYFRLS